MRPLFGTRGLPPEVHASWRRSLSDRQDVPVRILAWARSSDGFVVGSPAVLSLGGAAVEAEAVEADAVAPAAVEADAVEPEVAGADAAEAEAAGADAVIRPDRGVGLVDPPAVAGPEDWRHVGWHEIEHGGWNAESRALSWTLYGGRRGRVGLADPGRLPELFRERVSASIAVERFVPLRGERGVTVTARRALDGSGTITWHSTLTRGLTWSTEGVSEEAERLTAELRSEYGSTPSGW